MTVLRLHNATFCHDLKRIAQCILTIHIHDHRPRISLRSSDFLTAFDAHRHHYHQRATLSCIMAIIDNLEIYVVSTATGERLQEYGNPERDAIEGQNAVEKYIEAESNVEFSIVVVLNAGFNYHKADGVKIFVTLDGTTRTKFYPKPSINIKADCLTKKFKLERKDMTLKRDGNWFRSRFSFGLVTVGM